MPDGGHPDASVGPLERGLLVLENVAGAPDGRTRASALVKATGLARSPVDRIATTLLHLGYLREEGADLVVAPALLALGGAYLRAAAVPDVLAPLARELADDLDESVSVAVPDGTAARFVVQYTRRRALSVSFRVGDLLPAERCAAGLLFAAEWDDERFAAWRAGPPVRLRTLPQAGAGGPDEPELRRAAAGAARDGWACDDQLLEPGLVAVAVPVTVPARGTAAGRGEGRAAGRAGDGAETVTVAALSVVSHTSRHSARELRDFALPRMRAVAARMAAALSGSGGGPARRTTAPTPQTASTAPTASPADAASDGFPGTGGGADGPGARDGSGGAAHPAEPAGEPAGAGPAATLDRTAAAKRDLGPEYLQSLARGLSVLAALGADADGMTLSAVAQRTGLARATARRSLLTLEAAGYVTSDAGRFRPLPRALDLGYPVLSRLTLGELAHPHLVELVERVGESASLAVLDGRDIRYVARVAAHRIMSVSITLGTRFPAHATSMGRVLLAELSPPEWERWAAAGPLPAPTRHTVTDPVRLAGILRQVAADGYTIVDQELEEGLRSIAVPVRGADGRVLAAVNVSLHAGRTSAEQAREDFLPYLREAAAAISADVAAVTVAQELPA
ncbi:putative IclR family transcriptional regulator [Actinacidiphila reveromycinica]|uniref:Putative IclR family transcriptional regulator n=1 Tax=Actinacidiphila reveromycinica TaxID=659352 RepID=A0A7U3UP47_9ACTN|nr:IclR family transcriptional regulator C-terminal domain-containing protein [Streptomyces sp. SN-593]BBA96115.1 putative IclR family transcriptional regulator [Streptomyces sp. SN-593]